MRDSLMMVSLIGGLALAACAPAATPEPAAGPPVVGERCGDSSRLTQELYLYT